MKKVSLLFGVLLALLVTLPILAQDTVAEQTISIPHVEDVSGIEETVATLIHMGSGVPMQLNTFELESGDVITVWWVVSNVSENCSDGVCSKNNIVTINMAEESIIPDSGESCCSTFINHMPSNTHCQNNCGSSNSPENCSDGICIKNDISSMDAVEESIMLDSGESCCSTFINHMPSNTHCRNNCGSSIMVEWGVFQGHLPFGDSSEVIFDRSLVESISAEIHFVIGIDGNAISVKMTRD